MSDGEFDWGGRLRKGIGGAQRFPQNGWKPFEECKGRRELDCDTPDGSCIRDFINVVDLAKAHVVAISRMLDNPDTDPIEIFNLGTGSGVSVLELINTFETATGVAVPHKIVGRREGDIEKVWANPHKANTVLGWKTETPLADTMKSAWKWQLRLREKGIM